MARHTAKSHKIRKVEILVIQIENGKKVLVSKPVTVNKNGNVSVKAEEGEYQLLNEKETKALQKEILKTVTPKTGNVSVDKGKKTTVKLSSKLDMDNVAKITYTSSDKSTVKVDKNGNIIAKKKGNVTVKVKVTLKDGTTKTVKVKVKVKKQAEHRTHKKVPEVFQKGKPPGFFAVF